MDLKDKTNHFMELWNQSSDEEKMELWDLLNKDDPRLLFEVHGLVQDELLKILGVFLQEESK